ncbi:pyrroloquinoline quinone precursor peptide PqqA [Aquabacter spiritensis]|uniref:Coenzyme PQQ synthesis protein A n=1 Tax=Aquabacter spiritensis TaxID=933073 RepID=A0A4V6NZI6_9HYPH|nr:pyrroloquinoline quinone precursor peptide PqqA [Aquabacter spiritensis]TCT04278.1 coenzyme PQQ precursor peptide PqqA [Aquabacter spiritensis]
MTDILVRDIPATESGTAAPAWQAPVLEEMRVGMEVTSYESADFPLEH